MSRATPHLCSTPNCANVVEHGPGKCEQHGQSNWDRYRRTEKGRARQHGYSHRWRKVRDAYLDMHPACEWPGCHEPAAEVHHRDGRHEAEPGANHPSNLMAVCTRHHRVAHALMREGKTPPGAGRRQPARAD